MLVALLFTTLLVTPASYADENAIHLRGVALPLKQAKLALAQGGSLQWIIHEGTVVKKGTLLARVDDRGARIAVMKSKAALHQAQLALDEALHEQRKTMRLKGERIVSDMAVKETRFAVDKAKAKVALAKSDLAKANLDLSGCALRAPYAGVVSGVTSKLGEWIGAGTAVLELTNLIQLELSMDVPPHVVSGLHKGVQTSVMDKGHVVGSAKVRVVMPFIDAASGLRRVIWEVQPNKGHILAGKYLTLKSWK
uniref:RND efflux pump membrane fusion protein barrel-sandwich domain-containing protein n=1 Tax=Magnetococcus massalia (strain MO-1) TaxID=451514 RepID=A0A1S7LQD8_MAGMO|nr:Exported protein of unknown function. putative membrane-fusion protein [Candidatus Magnetococcus massalia]